jgi:hypothetical protein
LSTGPKTKAGRKRIAAAARKQWREWRLIGFTPRGGFIQGCNSQLLQAITKSPRKLAKKSRVNNIEWVEN